MIPMDYLIVIERATQRYAAYVSDLPGVGVAGRTLPEVRRLIRRAVELHVTGLREDKLPVPRPRARSEWIDVPRRSRLGLSASRKTGRARVATSS